MTRRPRSPRSVKWSRTDNLIAEAELQLADIFTQEMALLPDDAGVLELNLRPRIRKEAWPIIIRLERLLQRRVVIHLSAAPEQQTIERPGQEPRTITTRRIFVTIDEVT